MNQLMNDRDELSDLNLQNIVNCFDLKESPLFDETLERSSRVVISII